MRICEHHFLENDFTSCNKQRLKKLSVPQMYTKENDTDILHVTTPKKTYQNIQPNISSPCFIIEKRKLLSPTSLVPCKKNYSSAISPTDTIHILTPTTSGNLQTSSSAVSTPDVTPKTTNKIIDFPASIKPKKLFSEISYNTNTLSHLKKVVASQKKLIQSKRVIISKLKKQLISSKLQNKHNKSVNFLHLLKFPSEDSKTLVRMQISRNKLSTKPWSRKEQQFAISIFYKSPSAYKFLRNSKKITLPGLTTIRRWIGSSKFRPGFNPALFKQLKIKADSMTQQEKYCSLVFDELKIKNFLEYSKFLDLVEGYEDLGPIGRTNKLAGQAMVFVIRGLYSSWKMPISYFLPATSVKHVHLSELLVEAVTQLFKCGLIVNILVCDQGASNVAAYKDLKITKDEPYFLVEGRKVFALFDVPHLFKNLRNHFIKRNLIFEGKEVSFEDIKKTYEFDKNSSTSRSLLHITDAHISPGPFQLMSCKLAMQLFSNRVSTAIQTCILTGQLKSTTAPQTVKMIKKLNDLLDCLNSSSLFNSNPSKCALSDKFPHQLILLQNAKKWFETLTISQSQKNRPVCFDGMEWTINSIILLFEEQKKIGYSYLLTRRVNSDVIENLFSVFRQRGGYNR